MNKRLRTGMLTLLSLWLMMAVAVAAAQAGSLPDTWMGREFGGKIADLPYPSAYATTDRDGTIWYDVQDSRAKEEAKKFIPDLPAEAVQISAIGAKPDGSNQITGYCMAYSARHKDALCDYLVKTYGKWQYEWGVEEKQATVVYGWGDKKKMILRVSIPVVPGQGDDNIWLYLQDAKTLLDNAKK